MTELKIPQTPAEKLEVLQKTRDILANDGWTKNAWVAFIDGAEKFCLYGAVEASMGAPLVEELKSLMVDGVEERRDYEDYGLEFNADDFVKRFMKDSRDYVDAFEGKGYDGHVDSCSLTTTMFDAAAEAMPDNRYIQDAVRNMARTDEEILQTRGYYGPQAAETYLQMVRAGEMGMMRSALQSINDNAEGVDAVLEVVDAAIEKLKAQVEA